MRMRRPVLVAALAAATFVPALGLHAEESMEVVSRVLARVPLVDGHNDAPWQLGETFAGDLDAFDFADLSEAAATMHTDIARLRRGGVGGQFWAVFVPMDLPPGEIVTACLEQIDLVKRLVARYDALEMAGSAADVERIHASGRIASMIGVEGGHCIDGSLAVLRQLSELGVGYMTLTHWSSLPWVDAATDRALSDGLSELGEEVVGEMNRLGMLVDLSHVSAAAMHDALDLSSAPVIFSHSGARAINPHPRNVPDDVLRRLPVNGGIVMVNFGAYFVATEMTAWYAERKAEQARLETLHPGAGSTVDEGVARWEALNPRPTVPLAGLLDHIDHIRRVAGIDHVGLGSDFDGVGTLPEGLEDVSGYPTLLAGLVDRGWSEDDIAKLAGLNILRVMREAEEVGVRLRAEPR